MPAFSHFDLALLNPAFDSPLVDVLTELEHLRRLQLSGTTPAPLFFQLKRVFHMLESLGSARIEGNHTTLADYVETALDGSSNASAADPIHEVANIEAAMAYVDEVVQAGQPITEHLVRELHAQTVQGLRREGDPQRTAGIYLNQPDSERLAQAGQNARRHRFQRALRRIRGHHDKLIAAEPGQNLPLVKATQNGECNRL